MKSYARILHEVSTDHTLRQYLTFEHLPEFSVIVITVNDIMFSGDDKLQAAVPRYVTDWLHELDDHTVEGWRIEILSAYDAATVFDD